MPQMAPISWLILMIIFSICFMIFNIINFFNTPSNNNNMEMTQMKINKNFYSLNWKW